MYKLEPTECFPQKQNNQTKINTERERERGGGEEEIIISILILVSQYDIFSITLPHRHQSSQKLTFGATSSSSSISLHSPSSFTLFSSSSLHTSSSSASLLLFHSTGHHNNNNNNNNYMYLNNMQHAQDMKCLAVIITVRSFRQIDFHEKIIKLKKFIINGMQQVITCMGANFSFSVKISFMQILGEIQIIYIDSMHIATLSIIMNYWVCQQWCTCANTHTHTQTYMYSKRTENLQMLWLVLLEQGQGKLYFRVVVTKLNTACTSTFP